MVAKAGQIEKLEEGEIFFFYRPRVEAKEVHGREDVQRFYMVLAAKWPRKIYRLFVVGRKKLPELRKEQHPDRRNWALNVLVSTNPQDVGRELEAVEYATETRGERYVSAARPIGEGHYLLFRHDGHTELAYALELPKVPGPAQEEFDVKGEASYIVAVKNPDISTPGAPSPPKPPAYPPRLQEMFGRHRWIAINDPTLLDYENTQVLLLGAHSEDVETELGIHINTEHESLTTAGVCRELRLKCDRERVKPLVTGDFPEKETSPEDSDEVRRLAPEEGPTKAGKIGGRAAARRAPSAAALAKLLAGIAFPMSRSGIVAYARKHGDQIENADEAVEILEGLPDRTYANMADVMSSVGEVQGPFVCPYDGETFDQKSRYERHMASAHPPPAVNAADIEKALAGIDYPKSKRELVEYAAQRVPPNSEVLRIIRMLPDRIYRDAAEVGIAFGELKAAPSQRQRSAADTEAEEPPSRRGGHVAATEAVSAAAVAKILGGIEFPATKAELRAHANRNRERVANANALLAVIDRLPERRYNSMKDVEIEVGKVL